jgi:hypothetical protein
LDKEAVEMLESLQPVTYEKSFMEEAQAGVLPLGL